MMPSFPVDISKSLILLEPVDDLNGIDQTIHVMRVDRIELFETRGDPLECSMQRGPFRCSNETRSYIVAHTSNGYTYLIPFCQMCVEDSGAGWLQALEQLAGFGTYYDYPEL